jgi:3-hydroxyacyl-CoA dehydrogenase
MTDINAVTTLECQDGIAVLTLNSPPVNALSVAVREGLFEGLGRAAADPAATAIVLVCAGRTFIAGADIGELGASSGAALSSIQDLIEASPKPVIAALHGTALGGGLELALCAHYRLAEPSTQLGLPEVKLGLLPGAGGTQRLPRMVGPEKALEIIASGEQVAAIDALALGLVDELAPEDGLRGSAVAFARRVVSEGRPLIKVRDNDEKVRGARGQSDLFDAFRQRNARKFRGFIAPEFAIRCVEAAVNLPFDDGLKLERRLFCELLAGDQSKAQRYVFFAERQVWKTPDVPAETPVLTIRKVGIVGAGTMGGGIAMNFANIGLPVTLIEAKPQALDRGLATIRRNYESTAKRGRLTINEVEQRVALLSGTLDYDALADCDLIIEAVFENMDVKKSVFARIDGVAKSDAILASNTSYLDINEMAGVTKRPESVIGLHFFSPANVMRLLEVVRGERTSKTVIATSMQLAKRIGKIAALVGVCRGFVGNRMLTQRQRQAHALVMEGAMPWDVDRVLHEFGFPMGPFAMSDLAGLDLGWSKERSKGESLRDILCEMDRRGQKNGAGYYDYDEQRNPTPSAVVERAIGDFAQRRGIKPRSFTDQEILSRCILPLINEGAKILQGGIATRASDIDVVWLNGYGWPGYRGGPMHYADTLGLHNVIAGLEKLQSQLGNEFAPAALLLDAAAQGTALHKAAGRTL